MKTKNRKHRNPSIQSQKILENLFITFPILIGNGPSAIKYIYCPVCTELASGDPWDLFLFLFCCCCQIEAVPAPPPTMSPKPACELSPMSSRCSELCKLVQPQESSGSTRLELGDKLLFPLCFHETPTTSELKWTLIIDS